MGQNNQRLLRLINFIAHLEDSCRNTFPALMMIAAGFFVLFNGTGIVYG